MAWLRAEQARGLVKKTVLAMAEGLAGINLGNTADWGLFGMVPRITGTVGFQGLVEAKGIPPKPGEPRPAYHALRLVVEKLGDFSEAKPLDLGRGVYAYKFTVRERPVYVLWYDDGRRYLPGDPEPTATVRLPLLRGQYLLTETPIGPASARPSGSQGAPSGVSKAQTSPQPSSAAGRTVSPGADGYLKLTLGLTPIFLEPIGK